MLTIYIKASDIYHYHIHESASDSKLEVVTRVRRPQADWKITQADGKFFNKKKPNKIYLVGCEISPVTYDYVVQG